MLFYEGIKFSLDPNEDPVSGLERVASLSNIQHAKRRLLRREDDRQLLLRRNRSFPGAENSQNQDQRSSHTLSEKYESLDYEIVENELYRAAENDVDHQVS